MTKRKKTVETIMADTIDELRKITKDEYTTYTLQLIVNRKERQLIDVEEATYTYTVR